MYTLDVEKAKEPGIKWPSSVGSQKKQENSRKTSTSPSLAMLKPLIVWITTNCKILKEMGIPDYFTCKTCMYVKKQQLELDMEQQTCSKLGKEYVKVVYGHPAYLAYVQSTLCEMPDWMNHKLESGLLGKISVTSDTQMIPHLWQKEKKN